MIEEVLRAQVLLGALLLAGVALLALHRRWPGPGRALSGGVDRLLAGRSERWVFAGLVVLTIVVAVAVPLLSR